MMPSRQFGQIVPEKFFLVFVMQRHVSFLLFLILCSLAGA
jgi:hypothetical protein